MNGELKMKGSQQRLLFSFLLVILALGIVNTSSVLGYSETVADNTGDVIHYLVSTGFFYEGTSDRGDVDIVSVSVSFDETTSTGKLEIELRQLSSSINSSYYYGTSFSLDTEDGQQGLYIIATYSSIANPSNDTVITGYWSIGEGMGAISPQNPTTYVAGNKIYWKFDLPDVFPYTAFNNASYTKEFFGFAGYIVLENEQITEAYVDYAPDDANTLGPTDTIDENQETDQGENDIAETQGGALSLPGFPIALGLVLTALVAIIRKKRRTTIP